MNILVDNTTLWNNALSEIELNISKANYSTWFKDTFVTKFEDGVVFIGVPNPFVKDWLYTKFHKTILKTLRDQSEHIRAVEYTISKLDKNKELNKCIVQKNSIGNDTQEMPLDNFYINREDNLNPRYTFSNFVVGSFNELAHAASQAIIKQPGIVYNPLFIYGSSGYGKTHLIQAIGNQIKHNMKDKKVYYMTCEQFANEYINALQVDRRKINTFKEKYRRYDVLIMDDVQFLSGKDKSQEELFHLFNSLYENNKQIIFSSDKHPSQIQGIEERLQSRFNQGMAVDISQPDIDSRIHIIRTKAEQSGIVLTDDIISFLALSIDGNIRELEGVINSVSCQSKLKNKDLNINEIKDLIKNSAKPKKMVSIKDLIKIVADFYNIDPDSICDKTRRKEVVRPRQVTMYILRNDFSTSYPTIGDKLGKRDHTTVIHSCEKIKRELKDDSILEQQINQIRTML